MRKYIQHCRTHFTYAALYSGFINLLMLTVPLYMLQVFDRVLTSRSHDTLLMLSLVACGALAVYMLLDALRARLLFAAGVALDGIVAPRAIAGMFERGAQANASAEGNVLRDVTQVRGFLANGAVVSLFDAPWMPFYLGIIFLFDVTLGWIATSGALALLALAFVNERLTRGPAERAEQNARAAGAYVETSLRNAEVARALGMQPRLSARWHAMNHAAIDAHTQGALRAHKVSAVTKFLRLALQVAMLAAGAALVIDGQMTAGVMMTGTLILARALSPVENAIGSWKAFMDARTAWRRLSTNAALAEVSEKEALALPAPSGALDAQRVSFAVDAKVILKQVSLQLAAGESLAIIGASGAGKTTLARLLTGVWPAANGTVRMDGFDVAQWPREQLGQHIGYLPQDVQLFAGSVAQNIARFGEVDDEIGSARVIEAAKRAGVHELIQALPQGYDTELGAGGARLSGGQRQRIALARALYGNPRLVVLDEPNSSMDAEGEQALVRSLKELREAGVSVVVITHHSALIGQADKLLVLKDGVAELFGPRAEVLARLTGAAASANQAQRGAQEQAPRGAQITHLASAGRTA
jgi:PrtD family type I secretion system ABC transporter